METKRVKALVSAIPSSPLDWRLPTSMEVAAYAHLQPRDKTKAGQVIFRAAWIGFALFVLITSWVSEDAYITLRVLDNFFHGYGLRWNINERVQAYTHPLWLLLHIPLNLILDNLFLTNVLLSTIATTGAVLVMLETERRPLLIILSCLYLPLFASKAFRDYAASGLENSLSYLLFATFGYILLKKYEHPKFWLYCSLTVSLSLLNRLDLVIFYAPVLLWLAVMRFRDIRWGQVFLGALPLAVWFAFSLWYYGFLFPNTKYAKLGTGIAPYRYIHAALTYAKYTLITDTVTALEMLSSLAFIILALKEKPPVLHRLVLLPAAIAMGVCWYMVYLFFVGGDYMVGRFWAFPTFAAVWLAYMFTPESCFTRRKVTALIAVLLLLGAPLPTSSYLRKICDKPCGMNPSPMIDARMMFGGNHFIPTLWPLKFNTDAHHKFVNWANPLIKKAPGHVEKAHFIGMLGYYAGPGNVLIDELALADPLLARLPVIRDPGFFVGHFKRRLPDGYIDAIKTGDTRKMDPSLAKYYEKLRLITSGDLMDPERLKTIVRFNLGMYDEWKRDYILCNIW